MKKIVLMLVSLMMIFTFVACDNNVDVKDNEYTSNNDVVNSENSNVNEENNQEEVKLETNDKYANIEKNPVVTMEMTSGDIVKIELYPKVAPTTVENFIELIEKGFYDGLTFHRLIPNFMAQGGDPSGDGTGGPGYRIKGEFEENGFKNDIKHEIGVISMARTSDNNGAGSQFFIVTHENSYLSLDGLYAGFGKVIEGMDVVYDIVNTEVYRTEIDKEVIDAVEAAYEKAVNGEMTEAEYMSIVQPYYQQQLEKDKPINPPTIKKMTVETFGVDYDEPEKITE